jgi:hypothetical protein
VRPGRLHPAACQGQRKGEPTLPPCKNTQFTGRDVCMCTTLRVRCTPCRYGVSHREDASHRRRLSMCTPFPVRYSTHRGHQESATLCTVLLITLSEFATLMIPALLITRLISPVCYSYCTGRTYISHKERLCARWWRVPELRATLGYRSAELATSCRERTLRYSK